MVQIMRRLFVQQRQRAADEAIAQAGEPACALCRQAICVAPHGVDKHHFAHPRQHRFAARTPGVRLGHRLLGEVRDPGVIAAGAQMQQARSPDGVQRNPGETNRTPRYRFLALPGGDAMKSGVVAEFILPDSAKLHPGYALAEEFPGAHPA